MAARRPKKLKWSSKKRPAAGLGDWQNLWQKKLTAYWAQALWGSDAQRLAVIANKRVTQQETRLSFLNFHA